MIIDAIYDAMQPGAHHIVLNINENVANVICTIYDFQEIRMRLAFPMNYEIWFDTIVM